jgi:hypothetical protein
MGASAHVITLEGSEILTVPTNLLTHEGNKTVEDRLLVQLLQEHAGARLSDLPHHSAFARRTIRNDRESRVNGRHALVRVFSGEDHLARAELIQLLEAEVGRQQLI